MNVTVEITGAGFTATRDGLDGLAALVNGQEVYFEMMAGRSDLVGARRNGGAWAAWPDLFEPSTDADFPNCWQLVAGVMLPE